MPSSVLWPLRRQMPSTDRGPLERNTAFFADQYPRVSNICIGQTVTEKVSIYAAARNDICRILRPVILEGVKHNRFALL